MKKKGTFSFIAVLMAAFLVVGMVPTSVLADNDDETDEYGVEVLSSLDVEGEEIDQEDIDTEIETSKIEDSELERPSDFTQEFLFDDAIIAEDGSIGANDETVVEDNITTEIEDPDGQDSAMPKMLASEYESIGSFTDVASATEALKQAFINRKTDFTLDLTLSYDILGPDEGTRDYYYNLMEEILYQMVSDAEGHNGNGSEGDYLHGQIEYIFYPPEADGDVGDGYFIEWHFTVGYFTTVEQEEELTNKLQEVYASFDWDGATDYEKICDIYEYIVSNVSYAYNSSDPIKYTAYSALINGTAVCEGFSQLFYRMCNDCGIDCRIISGTAGTGSVGAHAWNIVKLGNYYYYCDTTWDTGRTESSWWRYFLKGSDDFPYHTAGSDYTTDEFTSAYPISKENYDPDTVVDTVDKSALQDEYDADIKLNEDEYSEESWSAFKTALANAAAVLADGEATQDQVDAALEALKTAKDALEKKSDEEPEPENVDKSALQEEYDEDEKLEESDYTEESWSAFKTAFVNAAAVLADGEATQDQVDAALEALKTAKDALEKRSDEEPEPEKVDKSALQEEYDEDAKLDESDYTVESWSKFEIARDNAGAVLANNGATQQEVNDALKALQEARDALEKKSDEEPEPEKVDKSALQEEYDEDKELIEDDYTKESWSAFEAALTNAETVLTDDEATQDLVDAALEALKTAKNALMYTEEEPKPEVVDKAELQEAYDQYKDLTAGDYTEESWSAFETALANAEAVLADDEATQAQIDAALSALTSAVDALNSAEDEPEPAPEPIPEPEPNNTRNISGSKTWDDDEDKADARPDSITVNLYQNGGEKPYTSMTVTEDDGWSWSWTVPENDENGNAYVYTIIEDDVKYYIPSYEKNGIFDITNTFVGEEGALTGSGTGSGGDNPKTGDTNNIALWLILMLAGAAGVFGVYRVRKRG